MKQNRERQGKKLCSAASIETQAGSNGSQSSSVCFKRREPMNPERAKIQGASVHGSHTSSDRTHSEH